jgi:hypothetical protein
MKLYLDNCSIQRPLDDRSQLRIAVESEIILNILSLIEAKKIDLLASEILIYEANKITNIFRKEFTLKVLSKRAEFAELDDAIEKRSKTFINSGIKPIDALHLASAEKMEADFFCTCDDKFLKKAVKINDLKIKAVSIFELLKEI